MTPNQKNATEVFVTGTAQISHGYTTVLRYVLLTHSRIQTLLIMCNNIRKATGHSSQLLCIPRLHYMTVYLHVSCSAYWWPQGGRRFSRPQSVGKSTYTRQNGSLGLIRRLTPAIRQNEPASDYAVTDEPFAYYTMSAKFSIAQYEMHCTWWNITR